MNITKLNEHVHTFMEEKPTNVREGQRVLWRHFALKRYIRDVNH